MIVYSMENTKAYSWWQTGIIYEIYLRSYQDSNGDGLGDLKGVVNRLDYLEWLGVNIIWVTPFYPSPMKDFGYDVSSYTAIDPRFGTMADFDQLLQEVHNRNMRLVIDFVPNHTSDQHPWFKASRESKENKFSNWYIWKDAVDGKPVNNWLSVLGGSAWSWDETRQQYYYHAFLKEQPDLNLENPDVQDAICEAMRFWLDKGVDGFRIDVMWHLAKDKFFRNNPPNPKFNSSMPDCDRFLQIYNCDRPEVHDIIAKFRKVLDEYGNRLMLGELYLPFNKSVTYYGKQNDGAHLPGNFQLMFLPWTPSQIGSAIKEYESLLPQGAWPNWTIGNHDRARLIHRIGAEQMKVAATLLLTLRGTPTMYYGDEISMPQVLIPPEEQQDPQGLLMPGKNLSRDPQRTPMQWNSEAHAGFTTGKPWLRLSEDYMQNNVQLQSKDENSVLIYYKRLIAIRASEPSLQYGTYDHIWWDDNILAYVRRAGNHPSFLVLLNMTNSTAQLREEEFPFEGIIRLSTNSQMERARVSCNVKLDPHAALVIQLL